jgi:hypothetical protein
MSDGIYAGLYLVGFASMARLLEKPEPATGLVFGALGGLAYLARPEGVGLILIGGALLGARIWFEGEARSKALASIVTLVLAGAVVMSSLLIPLAQQTGEITLTRKKSLSGLVAGRADVKIDERAALPEPKKAAQKMAIPLPRSSQQADGGGAVPPPRTLLGFGEAISEAVRTSLAALRYEVALFAALGVGLFRKPLKIEREAAVFAPAILYTGVLILLFWGAGYVARRHALAALLPLCAYAAIGWRVACTGAVDRFLEGHEAMASRLKSPVGVCLLLVLALGIVWGPRDVRPRRLERTPMRSAAEWLGRHDPISQPVAAQKLRVAYYAGARFVPLPSGTNGAIERQLRALGAHWVVIDEAQLENHRGLAEGLDDWLVPVHTVKSDGHRVLVLKMRSEPAI